MGPVTHPDVVNGEIKSFLNTPFLSQDNELPEGKVTGFH